MLMIVLNKKHFLRQKENNLLSQNGVVLIKKKISVRMRYLLS